MGGFGENLRSEREARGVTLEEISQATRISVRLLRAIEDEAFDRLPGGVFNVNFVRQYARHVSLDEEKVVAEFRKLAEPPDPELAPFQGGATLSSSAPFDWDRPREGRTAALVTAALVVVAAAGAGLYLWRASGDTPPVEPAPVSAPQTAAAQTQPEPKQEPAPPSPEPMVRPAAPPPAAPVPATAAPATEAPPGGTVPAEALVRVEVLATEEVWVSAVADGKVQVIRTLAAGERRVIEAQQRVRLRVGKAGAVKIFFNGQEQPPLGSIKHPRTAVFTTEGMQIESPAPKETPSP